jgi:hypothetical protein
LRVSVSVLGLLSLHAPREIDGCITTNVQGTTNVHMEVSSRLQGYSHLLHTLQTDPAALIPLIPHAIDRVCRP